MNQSATHVQKALIASLVKLENSNYLTDEELQGLRGSVMRLVTEFSVLKESDESERSETRAA